MIVFCPTVSVFVGLSYWFKSMFMGFAVVASSAKLQLLATMVAGAMSNLLLSVYRCVHCCLKDVCVWGGGDGLQGFHSGDCQALDWVITSSCAAVCVCVCVCP